MGRTINLNYTNKSQTVYSFIFVLIRNYIPESFVFYENKRDLIIHYAA